MNEPTTQQTTDQASRVTRITIGRLYNLGNYEHVRYEIAADVGDRGDACAVFTRLTRIIEALKPARFMNSMDGLQRRIDGLRSKIAAEPDESERRVLEDNIKESLSQIARQLRWEQRRQAAIQALEDLGGSSKEIDAKLFWDDDEEY